MKPLLLDLFCGAGGAAMGYSRAGFDIVGVDIKPQPNYPFSFHQGDALDFLIEHWGHFDAIHASPPCQAHTTITKGTNAGRFEHVDWIPTTRAYLDVVTLPSIIENVPGSGLRRDLVLCGEMFGLDVIRHRYFELRNWEAVQPPHKKHRGRVAGWRHGKHYEGPYVSVYGHGGGKQFGSGHGARRWQEALGVDWTKDREELAEMIPPAYTEMIGRQLMSTTKQYQCQCEDC